MKKSELEIMNRSFSILDQRRTKLIKEPATLKLKERVQKIRQYAVDHLDELIDLATQNLEENGVEVVHAKNGQKAREIIYKIIKESESSDTPKKSKSIIRSGKSHQNEKILVAKSKSNTAGEILLTEHLEEQKVEVLETDLGDRIVQMHYESRPSHPIGPAAHLDMENIAQIVSEFLDIPVEANPRPILNAVKDDILKKLPEIKVGITGANSVAAQDGSLLMVHNEGNISLLTLMDLHIILVGIDKVVPTIEDAVSVVKLETIYATGKKIPAYMNVVSSPSKTADIEQILLKDMYGAKRVVVVFLDNGRREGVKYDKESWWCIGCGSCIVNCPVYSVAGPEFGYRRHLGGRGIVVSRFLENDTVCSDSGLFKCTLCGNCTWECPLEIPTGVMVEEIRGKCVKEGIFKEEHSKIKDNVKKRGSPYTE
ncbi:MAG TPA: LUD domain-containing protein [Methanobacteriaceae archaeon]|nr:LUD domain-containing protein [Methanobacteriaceae archaeon]